MSWKYNIPREEDFETYEEFTDAMNAYENALDDYCDRMEERRHV